MKETQVLRVKLVALAEAAENAILPGAEKNSRTENDRADGWIVRRNNGKESNMHRMKRRWRRRLWTAVLLGAAAASTYYGVGRSRVPEMPLAPPRRPPAIDSIQMHLVPRTQPTPLSQTYNTRLPSE